MRRKRINLNQLNQLQNPEAAATKQAALTLPARILGIDAALRCTGYGLVQVLSPDSMQIIDCGVIRTSKDQLLSECLRRLRCGICELLSATRPAAAALESGFFHRNVKTAMNLGAARGVVISAIAEFDIPIFEYAPRQIKQAVCGYGNAEKSQVALMVAQMLGITLEAVDNDATDALGAALCHIGLATRQGGLFVPNPS